MPSAACEHVFVTSQGHAHARVRRALLTTNMTLIEAAAADLGHVRLADALAVLAVMAERRDPRFERAATRFAARVTSNAGSASPMRTACSPWLTACHTHAT
jgi:hypothetical protein